MVARVEIPATARRGEIISMRIAIQHPMETGFRYDNFGRAIPRNVINTLTVKIAGVEVFRAELGSGIAANPLLQFYTVVQTGGEVLFEWIDDTGQRGSERAVLNVVP